MIEGPETGGRTGNPRDTGGTGGHSGGIGRDTKGARGNKGGIGADRKARGIQHGIPVISKTGPRENRGFLPTQTYSGFRFYPELGSRSRGA
jgi:hypothetical protein